MSTPVVKRSIKIKGRKTSISLEDLFWRSLKEVPRAKKQTVAECVSKIKLGRVGSDNLSSAVRVYILSHVWERLSALQQSNANSNVQNDRREQASSDHAHVGQRAEPAR